MSKNKKNKKKRDIIFGSAMLSAFLITLTVLFVFNAQVTEPIIVEKEVIEQREWKPVHLGDASVADDVTGFMYIMIYPHQADPGTAYASNLSNSSAHEYSDSLNCSLTGETPYNTAVDIVYKFQICADDGYNSSGATWENSWIRAYCNESLAWSISAEAMTLVSISNDGTSHRWVHFYLNNGGSGYQLSKGESFNVSFNFEVYG